MEAIKRIGKYLLDYFALFFITFMVGFYLLGGEQVGFSIPLSYSDDGLSYLIIIKLLLEGNWLLESSDLGFPFGMNLFDFPGSAFGNRTIFIIVGIFTKNPVVAFNLFSYLSFPVSGCATYFLGSNIGLKKHFSYLLSILFAFSTFSLQRIIDYGHLVYLCNFVVPLFFYLGYCNYQIK